MVLVVFNNGTLMKRMRVLCSRPQMSVCLNNDLPEEWRQILAAAVQTTWQLYSNIEQAVCFWFLKLERLITLRPRYNKFTSKVNSDVVRCFQINVNFMMKQFWVTKLVVLSKWPSSCHIGPSSFHIHSY